jgi:hypothetical protein
MTIGRILPRSVVRLVGLSPADLKLDPDVEGTSLGRQTAASELANADETHLVFEGYPEENVEKMQPIRDKYGSDLVFTDLMLSGWKVARAFYSE